MAEAAAGARHLLERDARHLHGSDLCRHAAHDPLQPRLLLLLPAASASSTSGCRWRSPQAVAASVEPWSRTGRFSVVWHGGEPLAAGRDHLAALFAPFGARRRAPRADQRHPDRRRLVRVLRRARRAGQRQRRRPARPQRRPGRPGATGRPTTGSCGASTRCAGTGSRSPRSAWSAAPRRAWPPSCTTTSSTWAARCSASTSRSWRASTSGPTAHPAEDVRAFWAELVDGLAPRPADPSARDRVVPAVRGRGAGRHVRRRAAAQAATRSRRSRHDGRWCLLSPELAGFSDPRYGDFTSGNVLTTPLARSLTGPPRRPGSPSS